MEDKIEELEEKEQVEEKEQALEKNSKKKGNPFLVVFIVIVLVGLSVACGWYVNDFVNHYLKESKKVTEKKDNKESSNDNHSLEEENNQETNTEEAEIEQTQLPKGKPVIAIGSSRKVELFDENFNLIWSHDTDDYIPYGDIAVIGNTLYFDVRESGSDSTMIANLYRINIKELKVEDLNIKLSYPWSLSVINNNQLLYSYLYDYHVLNLDTKKDELLDVQGNNKETVIHEKLLYTKMDTNSLNLYDLKTKEDKKIADDARITQSSSHYIEYVTNYDNKYYLYDVLKDKTTYLYQSTSTGAVIGDQNMNTIITTLYDDTLYIVDGNSLYTLRNNQFNKIYELSLKENESISRIVVTNVEKGKFFMTKFIEEGNDCNKGSCTCGPTGVDKHFILDIQKKKEYEVNVDQIDLVDIEYLNY